MGIRKGIRTAHPEGLLAPLEHLQLAPELRSNKLPQDDGEVLHHSA
jgi:hypothetical protein